MKHQWLTMGLAVMSLGFGLEVDRAIAQSNMQEANLALKTSLCAQNWTDAIRAIDTMTRLSPGSVQSLSSFRERLVVMQNQNLTVPNWPTADYCAGKTNNPSAIAPTQTSPSPQTPAPATFNQTATSQATTYEENNLYRKVTIHLDSPETIVALGMANNQSSTARQAFATFVGQYNAAIVASGTYAAGTNWPLKSGGNFIGGTEKFAQYSTGTVLGLRPGNIPQMITIKKDGTPNWDNYQFALTSGPRLLKGGQILPWQPAEEGFGDPKVTNTETPLGRTAIGFSGDGRKLYYVVFKQNVSLRQAAQLMKTIGCTEAMNLDGGGTQALARNGNIIINSSRTQTHALVVFDVNRPAPTALKNALGR
jgi:uncharacterized protein YigE (DUF2233 family)